MFCNEKKIKKNKNVIDRSAVGVGVGADVSRLSFELN
jgi:hypothetical protein